MCEVVVGVRRCSSKQIFSLFRNHGHGHGHAAAHVRIVCLGAGGASLANIGIVCLGGGIDLNVNKQNRASVWI